MRGRREWTSSSKFTGSHRTAGSSGTSCRPRFGGQSCLSREHCRGTRVQNMAEDVPAPRQNRARVPRRSRDGDRSNRTTRDGGAVVTEQGQRAANQNSKAPARIASRPSRHQGEAAALVASDTRQPGTPTEPNRTRNPKPDTTTRQPDNPTTRQPDNPTTRQPDNPTTRQPDNPTTRQPDNPTTRQPDSYND